MKVLSIGAVLAALALCLPASAQTVPSLYLGTAAATNDATRTVTIEADTRWVNVAQGETVRFVAAGIEFAWRFDGQPSRPLDLQLIAPAGSLKRPILVYIARPPPFGSR